MNLRELIEEKHISGVYYTSLTLSEVKAIASKFEFYVYHLRGEYIHDIQDFFNQAHASFDFMLDSYANWDAFRDYYIGFPWLKAAGHIIYYDRVENFASHEPEMFKSAYAVFEIDSRETDHNGKLYVLFSGDMKLLPLSPDEIRIVE